MKKLIQTIKNIWSIEELRGKILFTLMMIAIYRVGAHIVLPGIDPNQMEAGAESNTGILGLIDAFSGGAFNQASIFALGIMPYISASIFMQLMTVLVPRFQKMQKEGESGRKKINQYTRYLTVIVTILQASAYVSYLQGMTQQTGGIMAGYASYFWLSTVVVLTAGTLFVMWMGEKITDKGLGNGTSLIIMIGIIARLPQSFLQELSAKSVRNGQILVFIIEIAILIAIIMGCILLIQGVRKVPVNYAKQIVGNRQFGGARQFLPLKVNSAGVMPIIFAQAIIFIPTIFANYNTQASGFLRAITDHTNVWYMLIYSVVVIGFTFLYTALIFNPKQIADNLKQNNGFIPGVKPGQPTTDYIGSIMDKITFPGALMLAFVGILPGIAQLLGVTQQFATFFGGTSLLIMVGVILDTLQQIETQLLMRQYDGLMKSGRIQGRQTTSAVQM
ncbi:MAG: preprotein translocase subunit SecY [Chitinophagaceae bacterium]|nr:preprotein translocase subunit SecY [Chitinophagaceae bacterium]MBK9380152.1 preprotein translocase subunit SecY [Chitinophagaceae bacterium]MBL0305446.1 preprotein translocase subunit SecY [Chitinophagaceae bacterium]HQV59133.1 preprotein translocase subunit SecY [Chitinophagaceae bacterium]HQV84580.1 preprotein translocase subunit SecY [Chitinophagaceae bacterium]